MCGPPALLAIGAGVSAIGTVIGGVTAMQQGKYQQAIAERNAANRREQITLEQEATQRQAQLTYRRAAQVKGQQAAAAAANGVSTNFGTAADIMLDTDMMAREDVANIYGQGHQNLRGIDREVANFVGQGRAARAQGRNAFAGSLFQAAGTALGGVSQYRQMQADFSGSSSRNSSDRWMWG